MVSHTHAISYPVSSHVTFTGNTIPTTPTVTSWPPTVSTPVADCGCCGKMVMGEAAFIWFSHFPRVDFCKDCEAYLYVLLPQVKAIKERAAKGEL